MNIYDIAKLAGVSIATVSRVVNDSPKVSEKTKEKVRAVMAANDYIPNVFARGMSLNSMKTVGSSVPVFQIIIWHLLWHIWKRT